LSFYLTAYCIYNKLYIRKRLKISERDKKLK